MSGTVFLTRPRRAIAAIKIAAPPSVVPPSNPFEPLLRADATSDELSTSVRHLVRVLVLVARGERESCSIPTAVTAFAVKFPHVVTLELL